MCTSNTQVGKLAKKLRKPLKLLAKLRKALKKLTQKRAFFGACSQLQPHATGCEPMCPACNPMCWRLQPHVPEAAALCRSGVIIGTVLLSCVVLALNAPYATYMTPRLSNTLAVLEVICTSIFTLEAVIFFIADGPSHYLQSTAHVFELVIVLGCWVDIICKFEKTDFRYSSMLAMLRALRPLAALQIIPSMKLVVTGLSRAVLGLGTMAVIVLFFFVVAGLAGMQLFATYSRYRCYFNGTDASVLDAADLTVIGASEHIGDLAYLNSLDMVSQYVSAGGSIVAPGGMLDPGGHYYTNCAGPWAGGSGQQCNSGNFFNRTGNLTSEVYKDIVCADSTVNPEHWNFDSFPWTCVTHLPVALTFYVCGCTHGVALVAYGRSLGCI